MTVRQLLSASALGAVDQAVLSGFSLLVGITLIQRVPKSEYALYALLTAGLLLVQSIQNALVASPMTTLISGRAEVESKATMLAAASRFQSWLSAGVVVIAALCALALAFRSADSAIAAAALGLAGVGVLAREFVRAKAFLARRAMKALLSDVVYVVVAATGMGVLVWADSLSAVLVIAVIGAAATVTGWLVGVGWQMPFAHLRPGERESLVELWSYARWSLPSVLNSWLYANAFLFLVEHMMSREAVADLSASRLLLVPISMIVVGWTNAFRPRAGQMFAAGLVSELNTIAWRSTVALSAVAVAYGLLLWTALPWLKASLLGGKYAAVDTLVLAWLAYFVANAVRSAGMACMLCSAQGFRTMYLYSWLALLVAVPAVWLACHNGSVAGVVLGLTLAETLLAGVIWLVGWPRLGRGG